MAEVTGPATVAPRSDAPRDASGWAAKVDRLQVEAREGVRGTNVAGKRLTGPVQGFGKLEDRFWVQTMIALAKRLGVAGPAVQIRSVVVDSKRQWRRAANVWHNAMARSVLQTVIPSRGPHP
jgi:hypothetical protein